MLVNSSFPLFIVEKDEAKLIFGLKPDMFITYGFFDLKA